MVLWQMALFRKYLQYIRTSPAIKVFIICVIAQVLILILDGKGYVDAIYCTTATFTTVGFGDVSPTGYSARLISIPFMVIGVLSLPSAAVQIYEHKMEKVRGMVSCTQENHIIIIGDLHEMIKSIVKEINSAKPICIYSNIYSERPWNHIHFIKGESLQKSLLRKAGVERACDAIIACSDDEETLLATALVRELAPNINIIATVVSGERISTLKNVGANYIVSTDTMIGRLLAGAVTEPSVVDLITDVTTSLDGHDICESPASDYKGSDISSVALEVSARGGILLGIVQNGESFVNPARDMRINKSDTLMILW